VPVPVLGPDGRKTGETRLMMRKPKVLRAPPGHPCGGSGGECGRNGGEATSRVFFRDDRPPMWACEKHGGLPARRAGQR